MAWASEIPADIFPLSLESVQVAFQAKVNFITSEPSIALNELEWCSPWTEPSSWLCRLGVLIEVNCETDFVARGAKFKELVQDMAMQAAASPSAIVVAVQDVPEQEIEKERAIEMGKEDIQSKPEAIRLACA